MTARIMATLVAAALAGAEPRQGEGGRGRAGDHQGDEDPRVTGQRRRAEQFRKNGNTSRPNRGYNANTGIVGVSFFFH